jgi:hypothetical protein
MTGDDYVLHKHGVTGGTSAHLRTPKVAESKKCRWWMSWNGTEVEWCWRQHRRTRTKTCSSATLSATTLERTGLGSNPGLCNERPETNGLSQGTAFPVTPTACKLSSSIPAWGPSVTETGQPSVCKQTAESFCMSCRTVGSCVALNTECQRIRAAGCDI